MLGSPWKQKAIGSSIGMVADVDEVRRALQLFADPENGCELRALQSGAHRTLPGLDIDGLVRAAGDLPGGIGLYFVLNPIPATLKKSASDQAVIRRRWLYVDVDPVKPDEFADSPATDEEKASAGLVADAVVEHLSGLGWPAPVVNDSGNGFGLFWRCDLPADESARDLCKAFLHKLREKFDGPGGKIDPKVYNAARITKLPGSWSRKGTEYPDRPYRPSRLVSVPEKLEVVSRELLLAFAPPPPPTRKTPVRPKAAANGVGNSNYGKGALEGAVGDVATAKPGERNDTLFKKSAWLGALAAGGEVDRAEAEALLKQAGAAADPDRPDTAATVERGLKAGAETPRQAPEKKDEPRVFFGKGNNPGAAEAKQSASGEWEVVLDGEIVETGAPAEFLPVPVNRSGSARQFEMHTLKGLMAVRFEEPQWVVHGLLSEGLNILAGKPKMGKSMMALNLAMTIAAGGKALGDMRTSPGDVLYISLEDRSRRIQARARKMLNGSGIDASGRLTVASQWPRQGEGGLELVEWWMKRVKRPALVIIDVWGKFRPALNQKAQAYNQDYEHMAPLKDLMDRYSCCGLALMHCRKGSSEDVVEDVSGTFGLAGAADGIVVLQRSRNDNEAKIFITGRDVADTELALRFDPESLIWTNLGDAEERASGQLQTRIVAWLSEEGRRHTFWKTKAIAEGLGYSSPSQIRMVLVRLNEEGVVQKRVFGADAEWCHPGIRLLGYSST